MKQYRPKTTGMRESNPQIIRSGTAYIAWPKRLPVILFIGAVVLAACGNVPASRTTSSSAGFQATLKEAEQTAQSFFQAWQDSDYTAMYALLSPHSKSAYDRAAFEDHYRNVADQMKLGSVDTDILDVSRQGTTAVVAYDVTFRSDFWGDIVDTERTLRLISTPEGWRIHWSTMDILSNLAEGTRLEFRLVMPARGNIYDRNGNILVDQNGRSVQLYMAQNNIPDYDSCLDELSRILRREKSALEAQMALFLPETLFLLDEIPADTYQSEEQTLRNLCGIGSDRELPTRTSRLYVGDLAPHLAGFVGSIPAEQLESYTSRGYPADALVGLDGIEVTYESQLAGQAGGELVIVAPTGEIISVLATVAPEPGQNIYLTVDSNLQTSVQQALIEAYNLAQPTWALQSSGAAVVVMDVRTGEILAITSYPWFDPELFNPSTPVAERGITVDALSRDPRRPLLNRATLGTYPAGSVFKLVSMAAGLDSGVFAADTTVECANRWYGQQYGDVLEYRTDWYLPGRGLINFPQALTYSCNPYFWQLGVSLYGTDPALLTRYANQMGLGVPTGQDILPEASGLVPGPGTNSASWALADTLNLVIGQGQMQVTPLQIVRMTAAIANGGQLFEPQFVRKIETTEGDIELSAAPEITSTLDFAPETFEAIRQAMCNVTLDSEGTARFVFEEWYTFQGNDVIVCGKTGTAQSGGENAPPHAWFTAFVPSTSPEIAVVAIVENSCEGSEVAAPIVRRIIEDYYGMPHSHWPPLWQEGCTSLGE